MVRISLIGSGVEGHISEIKIFIFLFHITIARCLNHCRKKTNACFWLITIYSFLTTVSNQCCVLGILMQEIFPKGKGTRNYM